MKKDLITGGIVMAIALVAWAIETLRLEPKGPARRWIVLVGFAALALALLLTWHVAFARDLDGRYAASPLKPWFDSLKSGKGPCCSDADGSAVSDADWESKDGRYRVRIPKEAGGTDLEWIDVPNEALITEPNRAGRTMVWPVYSPTNYGVYITIRCFMPGSMT